MRKRLLMAGMLALAGVAGAQAPTLKAPDGFKVTMYADGFQQPRFMAVAPNGDVLLSDSRAGTVVVLPDRDRNGRSDRQIVFASGLNRPHGLAFHGGFLYVANTDGVVRFRYANGQTKASGAAQRVVSLPPNGGHWTRTVAFGPDGRMYVSVGSNCNVCEETDARRAAVWVYDADGKNGKPYATGLRNAVGLEWFGGTLHATNNGRDMLGDDLPPEGFYKLRAGGFYGWPYCYTVKAGQAQVWDKDFGQKSAAVCKSATPAFALTTAHSAPLGLAFYTGKTFPSTYRGQMFAALHGSWNRSEKSGYKVVTVNPQTGQVRDFLTGFLRGAEVLGRPVDPVVARDGALLVTDDGEGRVWRVQYTGK
ncbi:glucose/arabinose dehydrogenase [Deinococcus sp. HSC-46F16]|uniref:PQQ-dependent sugar dehydrogenase n=1 Tax=Deinococcus sp. HSC-46F16 TaxID=2910968 RepID=UPI0020A07236|nr:sorbosone dehydrogenase family protein [Deinococcus sp. HSC-46F16]MCP2013835.1 glucose/arabinose dehydrogenase [Deinococcus sp. HSC-46F16]